MGRNVTKADGRVLGWKVEECAIATLEQQLNELESTVAGFTLHSVVPGKIAGTGGVLVKQTDATVLIIFQKKI